MLSRNAAARGEQALAVSAAAESARKALPKERRTDLQGWSPRTGQGRIQAISMGHAPAYRPHLAASLCHSCLGMSRIQVRSHAARDKNFQPRCVTAGCWAYQVQIHRPAVKGEVGKRPIQFSHTHDKEISGGDQMNYRIQVGSPKQQTLPDHPLSTATVEGAKSGIKPARVTALAARHSPAPRQRGQQGSLLPSYKLRTWGSVPILRGLLQFSERMHGGCRKNHSGSSLGNATIPPRRG